MFLATIEVQVFLLFSVDAKVEAQYKNNLSVHKKIDYYRWIIVHSMYETKFWFSESIMASQKQI